MRKICVISSSFLGAYLKYLSIFKNKNVRFLIISSKKIKNKIPNNIDYFYFSNKDNKKFNKDAYEIIKKFKPNKIILFYTKKISKPIFSNFKTINIHNSFLPYYKGLNALKKSFTDNVKFIISSSHYVTEKFDSGEIIHQIVTPVKKKNIKFFKQTSFFHRVVLLEAIISLKSKKNFTIINNETIISPGLEKKNIKYKFWK